MTGIIRSIRRWNWLALTATVSLLLSAGGIYWSVRFGAASDGGRGGAIGCALTFLMFFASRPTSEAALQADFDTTKPKRPDVLITPPPKDLAQAVQQIGDLKQEMARLRGSISALLDNGAREKIYLSIASVASTLAWGFGDMITACFKAAP